MKKRGKCAIQGQRGGEKVEVGVRVLTGCYNTTDKYRGIKIKVTDHFS